MKYFYFVKQIPYNITVKKPREALLLLVLSGFKANPTLQRVYRGLETRYSVESDKYIDKVL